MRAPDPDVHRRRLRRQLDGYFAELRGRCDPGALEPCGYCGVRHVPGECPTGLDSDERGDELFAQRVRARYFELLETHGATFGGDEVMRLAVEDEVAADLRRLIAEDYPSGPGVILNG